MRNPRTRFLAGVLSTAMVLACVGGAMASFGTALLPSGSWHNPFEWDAPTRTVARFKATEADARKTALMPVVSAEGETILLDDWNYTAITRGLPVPSPGR